jgi:hypothetical protein
MGRKLKWVRKRMFHLTRLFSTLLPTTHLHTDKHMRSQMCTHTHTNTHTHTHTHTHSLPYLIPFPLHQGRTLSTSQFPLSNNVPLFLQMTFMTSIIKVQCIISTKDRHYGRPRLSLWIAKFFHVIVSFSLLSLVILGWILLFHLHWDESISKWFNIGPFPTTGVES